jgi:hypothetical protein
MPPQKYRGILYQQEAPYFGGGIVNVYKVLPKYSLRISITIPIATFH